MPLTRSLKGLCIGTGAVLAGLVLSIGAAAAAESWVVGQTRGTVFSLVDGKWQELARGAALPGQQVVRTLASGRLKLALDGVALDLWGGTAIQILDRTISQYSGKLTAAVTSGPPLELSTGVVTVAVQGVVTVSFNFDAVRVDVQSGTVAVIDSLHGTQVNVARGDDIVVSATNGIKSTDVAAASMAANGNNAGGNGLGAVNGGAANSNAAANSSNSNVGGNNGNNGNGNGNSGNGNGNSSDNGNGNGGDNGNSGGNGSGNGGENGNSGGNGNGGENGNAGGNGNGNGN